MPKKNPTPKKQASEMEKELNPSETDLQQSASAPSRTADVETVEIQDRVRSVSTDADDSDEPEFDEPALPPKKSNPEPAQGKRRVAINRPTTERTNFEDRTFASIPYGEEDSEKTAIFEREAQQLKYDMALSESTDAGSIYATLKTYLLKGRSLMGTITGVSIYNGTPCWSIFHGKVSIYIPFDESYMTVKKNLTGKPSPQLIYKQKNFLSQSIGLSAEFILTSIQKDPANPGCYIATASRTTALARRRLAYFGEQLIRKGATVAARVISVSEYQLFVTVAGMDVPVHRRDLTRRYIKDLRECYQVNQTILMQVMDIDYEIMERLPNFTLSAIPMEEAACAANRFRLTPGERCLGIVTFVNDGKSNSSHNGRINLWLEGYDYPATTVMNFESTDNPISIGSRVLYEHRGFTDRNFSHGVILRYLNR